jgi:hypothetical protein
MTVKRVPSLPSYELLVPPADLVYGHKHYCGDTRFRRYAPVSDEQYIAGYRVVIEQRLSRIAAWYGALPTDNTSALTLCCYCQEGAFCHRQLVSKLFLWLNKKLHLSHVIELH